jgi:predicted esterase
MKTRASLLVIHIAVLVLGCGVASAGEGGFTFEIKGETFTYTDANRSFDGRILFPPGNGPFPAILFNHGQGGSPFGFPNIEVMRDWGAVVIAPTLTHVLGGATDPPNSGQTPENLARGIACVEALAGDSRIDSTRLAVFGHSKGAYASIGHVGALGNRILVAAMSAGGVVPDAVGTQGSPPTITEATGVTAPFLMFHGNIDPAVSPQLSVNYVDFLNAAGVPNQRIVYDVTDLPGNLQHNLHMTQSINDDMLLRLHDWFAQWGLFGASPPGLFGNGFEDVVP